MRRIRITISPRVSSCVFFVFFLTAILANASGQEQSSTLKRTTATTPQTASAQQAIAERYAELPLSFEVNRGQTDGPVRFLSRGTGYSFYLTKTGATLTFAPDAQGRENAFQMQLAGANGDARIHGVAELPGKSNYFLGSDSRHWFTGVPTYSKVAYENIYPGINLVYYGNQRQLEYDFVVSPGADPQQIRLSVSGAQNLFVDAQGNLVLHSSAGDVQLLAPKAYQQAHGRKQQISGQWNLLAKNVAGFRLGAYDRTQALVIDPVLMYSSFLGGSQKNSLAKIAIDNAGNAYVAGYTNSGDFPTAPTPMAMTFGNGTVSRGAFVAKIDPTGKSMLYSTYLSGNSDEDATGLAIDSAGNVYVAGTTHSTNFPTVNPLQAACTTRTQAGTCSSAFLTKIAASGSSLIFSTYLGGSGEESARGLAVDAKGSAYLVGVTSSPDFPVTAGAAQTKCAGTCQQNAFLAKFDPNGAALNYATYLGGSGVDDVADLALDGSGNVYVVGKTTSPDFPTVTPFQKSCTADSASSSGACLATAFVSKVKADGSAFVYSTYLGGSLGSQATAIAVDKLGSAYVTGSTQSADFPVLKAYQKSCAVDKAAGGCSVDAFLTKFSPTGNTLVYSTYVGGSGADEAFGIAVDASRQAYVIGRTTSPDFPTVSPVQKALKGTSDAFVTRFDATGTKLNFSTYHGGSATESAAGIAVDGKGSIFLAGQTSSTDFPTNNAFQTSCAGTCSSSFITKMAVPQATIVISVAPKPASIEDGQTQQFTATGDTVDWTLTTSGNPCSPTCGSVSPTSTADGVATTYTAPGPGGAVTGQQVTLTATSQTDSTALDSAAFLLTDFSLAPSPTSFDVSASTGGNATTTITATGINGYSGTITLACDSLTLPTGASCGFSPSSISLSGTGPDTGTSTLTVTVLTGTTAGTYPVTINGTDAATAQVTESTSFTLNVVQVDVTPTSGSMGVDNTAQFSASITPSQSVNWTLTGANCSGAACGSVSPSTTASGVLTTYTAPAIAPLGVVNLIATTDGGITGNKPPITVRDFKTSLSPISKDIAPGGTATTTVSASAFNANGYSGTLTLSCDSGLPTGAVCSFNPPTLTLSGTTTLTSDLTITTQGTSPAGAYTVVIKAISSDAVPISRTKDFALNLVTVDVAPASATVEVHNTRSVTATVVPAQSVTWSLTGTNCSGAACGSVSPTTTASGVATTYTAPATAPLGTVTLTAATAGGIAGQTTITVTDFAVSVAPTTSPDIAAGASTTTTLTASAFNANGYSGTLTLSCGGLPSGWTCSFGSNPFSFTSPATGSSTVTVNTTSGTVGGVYDITISANDGAGVSHGTNFAVNVVTITVTPSPKTVEVNNSQIFVGSVSPARTITWSLSGTGCSGATCGSINPTTSGSPVTSTNTTYTAPPTAPAGNVTLQAASGTLSGTATITVSDFTAGVGPVSQDVIDGTSASTTLTIGAVNGYAGTITPTCTGLPAGAGCSFNPPTINGAGTSTVTITTTAGTTPTGPVTVTINATDAAPVHVTHSATFTLTVVTIVVAPGSAKVEVHNTQQFTGTVSGLANTTATFSLAGTNCSGASCGSVSPGSTPNETTPTTYTAPATAPAGTVSLSASAVDGLVSPQPGAITVTDYSLSVSTNPNVAPTGSVPTTVNVSAINGYTGTVNLSCSSGLPVGASCSFNANPAAGPGSSTLTVNTTNVAAGIYTVTVSGTDAASVPVTHTTTFSVHVVQVTIPTPPPPTGTVEVNQTLPYSGSTLGLTDATVNWSIVPTNCVGSACGTLSTSGPSTSTNYTSPASTQAGVAVAIKATANDDSKFSQTTGSFLITDYSVSLPAPTVVLVQGANGSTTLTSTSVNSYAGTINTTQCGVVPALGSAPSCSVNPPAVPGSSNVGIQTASGTGVGLYTMSVVATDAAATAQMRTSNAQPVAVQCNLSLQKVVPTFAPAAATQPVNEYSIGVSVLQGGNACPYGDAAVVGGGRPNPVSGDNNAVTTITTGTSGTASAAQAGTVTFEINPNLTGKTSTTGSVSMGSFDATQSSINGVTQAQLSMPIMVEADVSLSAGVGATTKVTLTTISAPTGTLNVVSAGGNTGACGVVGANGPDSTGDVSCTAQVSGNTVELSVTVAATLAALNGTRDRIPLLSYTLGFPAIVFLGAGFTAFGPKGKRRAVRNATIWVALILLLTLLVLVPGCGGGFTPPQTRRITGSNKLLTVMAYFTDASGNVVRVEIFTVPVNIA